jgi:hypothetical protein
MMMIEFDIELPSEWAKRTGDNQHRIPVTEYQYTTAEDTTFIVSILPQANTKRYKLRLSTITLTAKATHVRHEYPVEAYETRADAVDGAESFIEYISVQLYEGTVSQDDPEMEEILGTIQDFTGDRPFLSIRRLVRWFRQPSIILAG